jgi:anti-sigma regulatory factor (Ser/Thr protein kinase)
VEVWTGGAASTTPPSRRRAPEKTFASHRKRGWGLQIIKSLMDDVDITSGEWGTRIVMRKYK